MNIALIFAGGTGKRMNSKGKPKQFLNLNGKPIIIHTIENFEYHPSIDAIILVCHSDWINYLKKLLDKYLITKVKWIVPGGDTGQKSIRHGLFKLEQVIENIEDTIVLIHDGVRPLIDSKLISDNINSVIKYRSGITVTPTIETIVNASNQIIINEIYNRNDCFLARAPQSFYLKDILDVHYKNICNGDPELVDSASLMHMYGYPLHTVSGPKENIKITTPLDFYIFRAIVEAKENSQIWGL